MMFSLALLTVSPVSGEDLDSLQVCVQAGDSCMKQYDTYEALKYYQRACEIAKAEAVEKAVANVQLPEEQLSMLSRKQADVVLQNLRHDAAVSAVAPCSIRMKLADCHYKRANYREVCEILKNVPEDSLSHDAFRQLAYSYQKQGDNDSFMYWAQQLENRFPMDGEVVAGLTLAYAKANQPQKGVICGMKYCQRDSTNILVNRALADAWFMNRDFTAAGKVYDRLLEQGDSTFNTLYSAGMCCSLLDSLERAYKFFQLAFLISGMQHSGCAYRLGVVCVDTKRYEEGLRYLSLARELMHPDTTVMRAITLSQGEGYYLTQQYPQAIEAWKEHLTYNPGSIATYYNIGQTYGLLLEDYVQQAIYYQKFLELAEKEPPSEKLSEMIRKARTTVQVRKMDD
jgi:tetratricopeptide (TPR) repeat protein